MGNGPISGSVIGKRLTVREEEVFTALAAGKPAKVVALDLGISHSTVDKHRTNAYAKLAIHTVEEAIHLGIASGRVPLRFKEHSYTKGNA